MDKTNFIPVDLHVHTPASKCYKGMTNDEEYINIIQNYFKKGIRVIAITDHNTVKGYKELCRIKNEINNKISALQEFEAESPAISERLSVYRSQKDIFDEMLILPGVELEANPGIHLLLVFKPEIEVVKKVEDFIVECGYTETVQGVESPASVVTYDVLEVLRGAKELRALTIAAHVDEDKGIYNDLKGTYRSRVFRSDDLDAISVNSTVNIDKIKELLSQPEYKRNKPIAFLQSSDHHRLGDCGKRVTYANMADLSFASLEKCFINPSANISPTAKPEIRSIISQIAQDRDTIIVESVDYEYILAAASALLNNNYGYLLLGVAQNRYKNIKGVEPKEGLAKDIIDLVKSSLSPEKIYYSIESAEYKWGERSVFVFAFTNISNHSFTYHDKHYHIENNAPVESTTTYLLSSKHKRDIILESFNENHYNKLNLLTEELQIISEQRYALKTIEYIEEDGITLSNIFDIELVKPVDCDDVETDVQFGNSSGKVYVVDMESVQKIRGEDYYVRCTGIRDNKFAFSSENKYSGKAILLTPRGATYLIMEDEFNIVNLLGCHVVLLRVSEEFSFISIFSVLAWLKSSAFLWYVETLFGDSDIFKADIFRKLRIPASLLDSGIAHKLESSILNIMEIERAFLRQQEEMSDSLDGHLDNEYLTKSAQIHNKKVDPIASEIDDIINTTIGIDTDTLVYLYNFLKLSDYHSLGR